MAKKSTQRPVTKTASKTVAKKVPAKKPVVRRQVAIVSSNDDGQFGITVRDSFMEELFRDRLAAVKFYQRALTALRMAEQAANEYSFENVRADAVTTTLHAKLNDAYAQLFGLGVMGSPEMRKEAAALAFRRFDKYSSFWETVLDGEEGNEFSEGVNDFIGYDPDLLRSEVKTWVAKLDE